MDILIATANLHKLREFRDMFKGLKKYELLSFNQFPSYIPPEETGATFQENAILKAQHAADALGFLVLADDSGLVVPALGGAPGVQSRRYAHENATDEENRKKLIEQIKRIKEGERSAFFECCLALALPKQLKKCVKATCEGTLLVEPRGRNGFGYDPLFVKVDYDKTFAELDEKIKNKISHRHKAFEKLLPTLEALLYPS